MEERVKYPYKTGYPISSSNEQQAFSYFKFGTPAMLSNGANSGDDTLPVVRTTTVAAEEYAYQQQTSSLG